MSAIARYSIAHWFARWIGKTIVCVFSLTTPAAFALEKPAGRVILTIEGTISQTNNGPQAQFDMKMLEKLPQHSF